MKHSKAKVDVICQANVRKRVKIDSTNKQQPVSKEWLDESCGYNTQDQTTSGSIKCSQMTASWRNLTRIASRNSSSKTHITLLQRLIAEYRTKWYNFKKSRWILKFLFGNYFCLRTRVVVSASLGLEFFSSTLQLIVPFCFAGYYDNCGIILKLRFLLFSLVY